jgi:von Willebrand factor type A domain
MPNQLTTRPKLPDHLRGQRDFILVDGSGSMTDNWWPLMEAVEAYVETLRKNQTDTFMTLTVFSGDDLDMEQRNCSIADWKSVLTDPIVSTWGDTPLFDAINVMARRLRDEDPARCAITIVTDGDNNGSNFTDQVQAKAILDWCRAKGWEVSFIGCDWNNAKLAAKLGSHASSAIGVAKAMLKDAAEELARKRSIYGKTGAPMHWSEEERSQFGGYLADHTTK